MLLALCFKTKQKDIKKSRRVIVFQLKVSNIRRIAFTPNKIDTLLVYFLKNLNSLSFYSVVALPGYYSINRVLTANDG